MQESFQYLKNASELVINESNNIVEIPLSVVLLHNTRGAGSQGGDPLGWLTSATHRVGGDGPGGRDAAR